MRVKRVSNGVTTLTPFPHYEVEINGSTSTVTKYHFFNGMRIAMKEGSTLTYLHSDHLGSTVLSTVGNAFQVGQGYYGYGNYRSGGALPTDHRYTGQKLDIATGLMYYGARYYDRTVGSFVSPDTLVPDPTNVWDYNRMMYVRGNPLKYNDPTGHVCVPVVNIGNTCSGSVNWDAVQASLDVAGAAEPTPFSDGTNVVISLVRGNYTDAGLSALGMVPYLGDLAKGGKYADEAYGAGKAAWRWGKEVLGLSDEAVAGFRSFTRGNFRENLSRLTGVRPDRTMEAHHILPQAFQEQFAELGINIHEPQFGAWVDTTKHREWSHEYNERWRRFFANDDTPTVQRIQEFATELAEEFGFDVSFSN